MWTALRRCVRSPHPRPQVGGPDPCCRPLLPVSRTRALWPVRQGLLSKGGLGAEVGTPPPWLQPHKAAGPD